MSEGPYLSRPLALLQSTAHRKPVGFVDWWTVTATPEGEFNDIPLTEREIELDGMGSGRISDGKVQEHRLYHDFHEMLTQLGLVDE